MKAVIALDDEKYGEAQQWVSDRDLRAASSEGDLEREAAVRTILAESDYGLKRWENALPNFRYLWTKDTNNITAALKLADCCAMTHQPELAVTNYEIAIREFRRRAGTDKSQRQAGLLAGAIANKANVLYQQRDFSSALRNLEEAVAMVKPRAESSVVPPSYAASVNNRATVLRALERGDDAVEAFDNLAQLLQRTPQGRRSIRDQLEFATVVFNRSETYRQLGDRSKADTDQKAAMKMFLLLSAQPRLKGDSEISAVVRSMPDLRRQ